MNGIRKYVLPILLFALLFSVGTTIDLPASDYTTKRDSSTRAAGTEFNPSGSVDDGEQQPIIAENLQKLIKIGVNQTLKPLDVIAVPPQEDSATIRHRITEYMEQYYAGAADSELPFIVAIPRTEGIPTYRPLPYPFSDNFLYVAVPGKTLLEENPRQGGSAPMEIFDINCVCGESEKKLATEQLQEAIERHRNVLEGMFALRNAAYQYFQNHGKLPEKLEDLTRPFPENYLSSLPNIAADSKNQAILYHPERLNPEAPWNTMKDAIPYATMAEPKFDMRPMGIEINRQTNWLTLFSGKQAIRTYPVALGEHNQTPLGVFKAALKVNEPISKTKVFGTRAIVLSDQAYAIHGTNDPSSIGKSVSKGCIRLYNNDAEELYSLISLGTPIRIVDEDKPKIKVKKPPKSMLLAATSSEKSNQAYHWRN